MDDEQAAPVPAAFLLALDRAKISYRLSHARAEALMREVAVPDPALLDDLLKPGA